ncbi:MAG: TonB-dependent receptor, partial [Bacteroidia bacterium]
GRTSSVLDIRTKEGNLRELKGEASLGIISAQIMLEGPIKKGKSSFLISARRTYLDLFTRAITRSNSEGARSVTYNFYDLTAKANWVLNEKSKLFVSAYSGDDKIGIKFSNELKEPDNYSQNKNDNRLRWGNQLLMLRWNRIWGKNIFSNIIATYTRYHYRTEFLFESTKIQNSDTLNIASFADFRSGIKEYGGILNLDYYLTTRHHLKAGIEGKAYQFSPGISRRTLTDTYIIEEDTSFGSDPIIGFSGAIYAEDEWNVGDKLGVNIGLRANLYHSDQTSFTSLEPRFSMRYLLANATSLKLSGAKMSQFVHQLSNSDAGIPTDLWVPATSIAPIQTSWIGALGLVHTFQQKWEISGEIYYKLMSNLIDYKAGQTFWGDVEDWQEKVEVGGKGEAYGTELFASKKTGATQGWFSYTLSWSNRTFTHLNQGLAYPFKYDNRHNLNVFLWHRFNKKVQLSGVFVFKSGNAVNLAVAKHNLTFPYDETINGWKFGEYRQVDIFPEARNSFRIAPYHRLDLAINFPKEKKWGKRIWSLSIYNLYARKNPYFYFFQDEIVDGKKITRLKQFSLFPIIPSITYKVEF